MSKHGGWTFVGVPWSDLMMMRIPSTAVTSQNIVIGAYHTSSSATAPFLDLDIMIWCRGKISAPIMSVVWITSGETESKRGDMLGE